MTEEEERNIFERLRETEAQTREQNIKIEALTRSIGEMTQRWDTQMSMMWKLIYILVGAVISIALGPKMADKLINDTEKHSTYFFIKPWDEHRDFMV